MTQEMRVFAGLDELEAAVGTHLGTGAWHEVTQTMIDQFAEATGDHQWIHVDPERAKDGPFGTTIAHGYLTLSLIPVLWASAFRVDGVRMGVNYGSNKVRFTAPVPVGSRVRASCDLVGVAPAAGGAVQVTTKVTVELEGSERPACIAETVTLYYA